MSADIRLVRWADRDRDDFERLTVALARVRRAARSAGTDLLSPDVPQGPEEPSDLDRARAQIEQNAARDAAAGANAGLFANPAWHIMLALFVAREDRRVVDAGSVTQGCGALPPAASRWLALLEQRGLIILSGEADGGGVLLTAAGEALVIDFLGAV